MTAEVLYIFTRFKGPHFYRVICASRSKGGAVVQVLESNDAGSMACEHFERAQRRVFLAGGIAQLRKLQLTFTEITNLGWVRPDLNALIIRASDKFSIGQQDHGPDTGNMALVATNVLESSHIKKVDGAVIRAGDEFAIG